MPERRDELRGRATKERAEGACARIADALARRNRDRLEVADFWVRGGRLAQAIDTVLAELAEKASRWGCAPRSYGGVLAACIAACAGPWAPRRPRSLRSSCWTPCY